MSDGILWVLVGISLILLLVALIEWRAGRERTALVTLFQVVVGLLLAWLFFVNKS